MSKKKIVIGLLGLCLLSSLVYYGFSKYGNKSTSEHKEHSDEHNDSNSHSENGEHDEHGEVEEHGDHHEPEISLSQEVMSLSGITIEDAKPRFIKTTLTFYGKLSPDKGKFARINPRYPGIVRQVYKNLGDLVSSGDLLATLDANIGLNSYELRAQFSGTIVERDIVAGEFVSEQDTVFKLADLGQVWVDLNISEKDYSKLRIGQKIIIRMWNFPDVKESTLSFISPVIHEDSQTLLARAIIPNNDGKWRPGSFVYAEVVLNEESVPIAVREEAIQIMEDNTVVFVQHGNNFKSRKIKQGRKGGGFVEILHGLRSGEKYVANNSFILKSELLKGSAEHTH